MTDPNSTPVFLSAGPRQRDVLDVVALGSAIVDVLVLSTEEELSSLGLVKGSMTLIDAQRAAELHGALASPTIVSGGSAANTAAGIAHLGGRVGYIGKVAADIYGEVYLKNMEEIGVELGSATRLGAQKTTEVALAEVGNVTGSCLVLVTDDGERTMATHLGVASLLDTLHIDESLVSRAQVLYLEGYLWDLEPARKAMMHTIEIAHETDALVALTVSDSFCVERHRDEFLELLQDHVDLLFANEAEAISLCEGTRGSGAAFEDAVEMVSDMGVLAALTRGQAGSVVVTPSGAITVPAEPVEQVIDTSGAGDLYAAGFLYGLTHGLGPEDSARLGSVCAAEIISHIGSRPLADLSDLAGLD